MSYTNPYGNYTVIDTVPEDVIHLVSNHWYSFPPLNTMWYGLIAFYVALCTVFSLTGNVTVIYIFMSTKSLQTPANYFVANLALSDFCLMFFMCPPLLVNSYYGTWVWGPYACQLYGVIGSGTGCTSIFLMMCISYDRYNVIVKGIGAKPLTKGSAIFQSLMCWVVSMSWTLMPLFGWGRYAPEGNMTACGTDYLSEDFNVISYVAIYCTWCYFIPLFFIIICYWFIVAAVREHENNMRAQAKKMGVKSLRGDADAQKKSNDCKLAKVAMVTVSLWFIAWTPYLIINMAGLCNKSMITPLFSIWGSVFAKANTVYNPIVYAISHPKYKTALYQKMPFLQCAPESNEDDTKSSTTTNDDARLKDNDTFQI
uniref:Opsin L15 n=2 Tax=Neogonodactylus oerstedii TaxID=85128 RepID=A0A6H0X1N5_NEOOE|nr:opsin L15 [Neogonodactylus oerstedii]